MRRGDDDERIRGGRQGGDGKQSGNGRRRSPAYKWVALSNTTLAMMMATIDGSIVIVAMPAIFRGIHLNPLTPGNVTYLLWMIMGYLLVQSVLVVTLGRLGDMFGRVKIYNLGFVVFTLASIALSFDPFPGPHGALWLIVWRVVQAFGGAMLMANSAAILTDAFPGGQRGMALGINQVAGISGQFVGLLLGGLLAAWDWRAIFWINLPFGLFGTVWAYKSLREIASTRKARIDWLGNLTFAAGAGVLLTAITFGIRPYGSDPTGWGNPMVFGGLMLGVALLVRVLLRRVEGQGPDVPAEAVPDPRVRGRQHRQAARRDRPRRPAVHAGHLARRDLAAAARLRLRGHAAVGGHLHAAAHRRLPLAGPISGTLSDRYGARPFATGGLLVAAGCFTGLMLLPIDFPYWVFALLIFGNGIGSGLFASPNTAAIMSTVPAHDRGAASGMRSTFQNSGMSLSIGIFFSLMVAGLANTLPRTLHPRADRSGRAARRGHLDRPPAARSLPSSPRCSATTRCRTCWRRPGCCTRCPRQRRHAHRQAVLPDAHLRAVPSRPDDRVHRRRADVGGRRGGVLAAREEAGGSAGTVWAARGGRRGLTPAIRATTGVRPGFLDAAAPRGARLVVERIRHARRCLCVTDCFSIGAVIAAAIGVAAGLAGPSPAATSLASTAQGPCGRATAPDGYKHVIWIWMENHGYRDIIGNAKQAPYINSLAAACGVATDYHVTTHPSLPNYLAATSGLPSRTCRSCPTWTAASPRSATPPRRASSVRARPGSRTRSRCRPTATSRIPASTRCGTTPRCTTSGCPGAPAATSPTGQLAADLTAGALPAFSFITPNLIDDMHDGTIAQGDTWLARHLPAILNSKEYRAGTTAVFITWDEGSGGYPAEDCDDTTSTDGSCRVPMIVISPSTPARARSGKFFGHYSLLATTEQLLRLPRLRSASSAPTMTAAFHL